MVTKLKIMKGGSSVTRNGVVYWYAWVGDRKIRLVGWKCGWNFISDHKK